MTSEACGVSPEISSFLEDAIWYFCNRVSREELQLLLTDDEAWERLVAEAGLSRDEADALHKGLNKLNTEQLYRKKFSSNFPRVKRELEEYIRELHTLADKVDKVHRDCTISNVVAKSTSAVSGILTILGLGLAPVTAGVSLALSTTGMGLGAAAAVTSVSASIVEYLSKLSAKVKASRLASIDTEKGEIVKETLHHITPHDVSSTKNFTRALEIIGKDIRAIKLATCKPLLAAPVKCLMTIGRISVQGSKLVQKSFGGTALAMTKGVQIMGGATTGVFILVDVVSLVKESVHFHEGAKTESAEELRQKARKVERKLEELTQIHGRLQ